MLLPKNVRNFLATVGSEADAEPLLYIQMDRAHDISSVLARVRARARDFYENIFVFGLCDGLWSLGYAAFSPSYI